MYDKVEDEFKRSGIFGDWHFADALNEFFECSIEESLRSNNTLVRMLAVLDRRVGKRTLEKLKSTIDEQPEWLRYFYQLRLESEGL